MSKQCVPISISYHIVHSNYYRFFNETANTKLKLYHLVDISTECQRRHDKKMLYLLYPFEACEHEIIIVHINFSRDFFVHVYYVEVEE